MSETKTINSGAIPSFFRDIEIIGPAHLEIPKYYARYAELAISSESPNSTFAATKSPILLASREVKETYQSNNFAKIKEMEAAAQRDLQPVYDNIAKNSENAWTKVRSGGKEFYMSWSATGCIWAYTENTTTSDTADGVTQQAVVQIGTYSASTQVVGIQSYNLTFPTILVESAIALIVAIALSRVVAIGLGFAVTAFAIILCEAAAKIGLQSLTFVVAASTLSTLAISIVFFIVFIGLMYLWNWLNRRYTIRLQIFNWDDTNYWKVTDDTCSNAKICGENKELKFTIPKMQKPGEVVVPPGFEPVEVLDSVCYYAVIVWENDNTFMEGCSMAIQMQKGETNEGFMWAFDCPRFSDNKQAGDDGMQNPEAYRTGHHWNEHPLRFQIQSTSARIPVSFALDALSGASDGLYNINMHINKSLEDVLVGASDGLYNSACDGPYNFNVNINQPTNGHFKFNVNINKPVK